MSVQTITRAEPSAGRQTLMPRHIVPRNPAGAGPADTALCGELWDRLDVAPGPWCEPCVAEYRRRHPGWPLPGGAP